MPTAGFPAEDHDMFDDLGDIDDLVDDLMA